MASGVSNIAVHWKSKSTLDDTLDVFPCHGVGGIVGMILTAVFAKDVGLVTGTSALLWKHTASMFLVGGFTFVGSWLLYRLTDLITPLRVEEHHEQLGLDLSQHGETLEQIASQFRKLSPAAEDSGRGGDALQELEVLEHHPRTANN